MVQKYKHLEGNVEEVKDNIRNEPGLDYKRLLEAERNGENRKTVKQFLRERIGDDIYDKLPRMSEQEVKHEVKEKDDIDLLRLLEAEKENRDREELLQWLRKQIKTPGNSWETTRDRLDKLEEKIRDSDSDLSLGKEEMKKIDRINRGDTKQKSKTKQDPETPSTENKGSEKQDPEEDFSMAEEAAKKNHVDDDTDYEEFERRIQEHGENFRKIRDMIGKVIVGQENAVEKVMIALMCDGNVLLEGVPGLGKSLLVETLQRTVSNTDSNRIQFVPDMLPSDILGQRVYNQKKGEFYINKGPVFTNFLLADEINRAPPKTQAAMMEVMQEKKVSIEDEDFDLEPPYLVLATQNPLEQKGTYPLPEAVIDRFFVKLVLDYPEPKDEVEILQRNSISSLDPFSDIEEVVTKEDILQVQEDVRNIYIAQRVMESIVEVITTARGRTDNNVESMKYVDYGPSPRASIWISLGASAYAILDGRTYVVPDDIKKVAKPILRHRILLNYEGKISDVTTDDVVEEILEKVDTV